MARAKNLILAIIGAILIPVFMADGTIRYSNSYFPIVIWALLYLLYCHTDKKDFPSRMRRYSMPLGLLYACMTTFGYHLEDGVQIPYKDILFWAGVLYYAGVCSKILCVVWTVLKEKELCLMVDNSKNEKVGKIEMIPRWFFEHPIIIGLTLLLCWLPCYISTFPGGVPL